jgi:hypothetical protein
MMALRSSMLGTVAAFNTSNTPKAMAWKCSKPFASLALKGLFQRSSMRLIARVRREHGSKSRIQRHLLQLALLMGRSKGDITECPQLTQASPASVRG